MTSRPLFICATLGLSALLLVACGQAPDTDPHLSEEDPSLFWTIVEQEKDWWEELKIGRNIDGKVVWLTLDEVPEEQSIYDAQFIQLAGTSSAFLQVYGETHMGNGNFYIYKIDGDQVQQVLKTSALDLHQENASDEDPATQCSSVLKDGLLTPQYDDLNGDGLDDLVLNGTQMTFCSRSGSPLADVLHASPEKTTPIEEHFVWDAALEHFVEQL